MLTAATMAVDAPPRTVMWTVSEVARRDGVSKQATSKKVHELAGLGLTIDRDQKGRVSAFNVVEYDRLRGRTDDPSKAQAPGRLPFVAPPAPAPDKEGYNEALRQKTWHEAERQRLNLSERKGELIPVAAVNEAVEACGAAIAAIVDRLPNAADDLAAAMAREGTHGLRVALKQMAFRQRTEMADVLATIAKAAPKAQPEPQEPQAAQETSVT